MKALALVVVLAAAMEARAQGGVPLTGLELGFYGVAAGAGALVAAHFVGFSTFDAVRGNAGRRWVIANLVVGAVNVAHGVGWFFIEGPYVSQRPSPACVALGVAQMTLGGLNLAAALLNAVVPYRPEREWITPVFLSGRTANGTGRRWSGVGLEVPL